MVPRQPGVGAAVTRREGVSWPELVHLQRGGESPLQQQLFDFLREQILHGRLKPGARLPSTRALAAALRVSRNTVIASYERLVAEGYLEGVRGAGTRVCAHLPQRRAAASARRLTDGTAEGVAEAPVQIPGLLQRMAGIRRAVVPASRSAFQPGLPAIDAFPRLQWTRLLARASRAFDIDTMGYGEPGGHWPLREAVAGYLGASRGVSCDASQLMIVNGAQAALCLAARLLLEPGDPVWIEDPGYLGARAALLGAGARLHPVPVDEEGMDVAAGTRACARPKLVYVTPSFQFPLGVTMSLERRLRLLAHAASVGAWVLEDDYDSEYRYSGHPLSAMQGLDEAGRVIYVGTFAKTLFPGLRVGYLVLPPALAPLIAALGRSVGHDASVPVQAALARFLVDGHFSAHVRRMRSLYAARRDAFVDQAGRVLGEWMRIELPAAGMQVAALLHRDGDDHALSRAAAAAGVVAPALSAYCLNAGVRGLHLGYSGVPEAAVAPALARLAQAARDTLGG